MNDFSDTEKQVLWVHGTGLASTRHRVVRPSACAAPQVPCFACSPSRSLQHISAELLLTKRIAEQRARHTADVEKVRGRIQSYRVANYYRTPAAS